MTFNSGTATDYIDLLDQLIEVVTGRHMATAAVNAGGTGHAVGDVITITNTGGTFTETAKIEVVTVSGGVITAIRVYRGGVYTVDPTTTTGNAQSATTGSGINATFDITFDDTGWTQLTREQVAVSATVGAAGTGYTNGSTDVLTLIGGVLATGGTAATFTATVSGGAVTSVALLSAGDYEVVPSNAVLTSVSPSGGTGCTLNVTWADKSGDTMVVLQGDAGSALDPLVGIKTYSSETDETSANTVYNWALFGMTSWSNLLAMHDQANVSDGFAGAGDGTITTSATGDGAFVPLKDSDAFNIEWWVSATGRRVVLIAKVEGASTTYYAHASFGLYNQFGVTSELPYPAYVSGSSDRKRCWYRDTSSIWGGVSEAISRANGPTFAWAPEGAWLSVKSALIATNQTTTPTYNAETVAPTALVWPIGTPNVQASVDDRIWTTASSTGFDNDDLTLTTSAIEIYRTPDTGGDLFPLYPVTVVQSDSGSGFHRVLGEMDGVFWFHDGGVTISSQDRFTRDSDAYTIFQNGTRVEAWSFIALRED